VLDLLMALLGIMEALATLTSGSTGPGYTSTSSIVLVFKFLQVLNFKLKRLGPPEQGLFWAPWRGLNSASRPCLGLLWDGGNSRPTRMYFASCGFASELCLNLEPHTWP
jgi:hypothetical protein